MNAYNDPKDLTGAILEAALGINYSTSDDYVTIARKTAVALGVPAHRVNYAELGTILNLIRAASPVIS